jgi:hypothetical protein
MWDAFKRTLAFTTQRDGPKYSPPDSRPSAPMMGGTNSADDLQWTLKWATDGGKARTAPPTGNDQPVKPNALDAAFQKMVDRRSAQNTQYPRYDNTTTNYSGDAPDRGRDLRYGLQPDSVGATADRPGSTFGLRPAAPAGNAKPDVDK